MSVKINKLIRKVARGLPVKTTAQGTLKKPGEANSNSKRELKALYARLQNIGMAIGTYLKNNGPQPTTRKVDAKKKVVKK